MPHTPMNPDFFTYAQLKARRHLPGLRRALGKIDREIEGVKAHIERLEIDAQFADTQNKTSHRSAPVRILNPITASIRESLRHAFLKREEIREAIEIITRPRHGARPLSAEARRAIAELPGTQRVNLSVGQRALRKALGNGPSLTGKHQTRKRRSRMASLIAAA